MPAPRVFFDANVLVSASLSRRGPAYALLHLAQAGALVGYTSVGVVREAERAIARVAPPAMAELRRLLGRMRLKVRPVRPSVERVRGLAHDKDLHVAAAALRVRAEYLVTFDLRDFRGRPLRQGFGLQVIHPKTLLRALATPP